MENEASKVFQRHQPDLVIAIGPSILEVTTVLHSKGYVTWETKNAIQTVLGISEQQKATTLVNALEKQLLGKEHNDQAKEYLIEICCVLINQNNRKLRYLCEHKILGQYIHTLIYI